MADKANRQDTLNYKVESVDSFGTTLKRERELRSIPLEDVAQATNIQLSYLQFLEEDNYELLPHPTFVKGFIRSYARYIGLNPDNVMANYEHFMASYNQEETSRRPAKPRDNKNKRLLLVVISGTFLILALLGYFLLVSIKNFQNPQIPTQQVQPIRPSDSEIQPKENEITGYSKDGENIPLPPTLDPNL